jgi:hypothetical protein
MRRFRESGRSVLDYFSIREGLSRNGNEPSEGTFVGVDPNDPQRTVGKSVELRRVGDTNEISTMLSGSKTDRQTLVSKVISTWDEERPFETADLTQRPGQRVF